MSLTDAQLVGLVLIAAMAALVMYSHWVRRAPLIDDPADPEAGLSCMSCVDAAAAVLVDELMDDIAVALGEGRA